MAKIFRVRRAFSVIEILMGTLIAFILGCVMILNPDSALQSSRREAERLAAKLENLTKRADQMYMGFDMTVKSDLISFKWIQEKIIEPDFIASMGCFYSVRNNKILSYNSEAAHDKQQMTQRGVKIFISNKEEPEHNNYYSVKIETKNDFCYVIISGDVG